MSPSLKSKRRGEQGQTIILVAVSIVSLLAMAALAIDVVTLYVAKSEIQRAADAAALAGAKAVADSGVTTLQPTDPSLPAVETVATNMANAQITALLPWNTVAGRLLASPPVVTIDFVTHGNGNPLITVAAQQTGLPTFFARIWGKASSAVQASATAEAYNPSNSSSFTPIAPSSVKPWLMANVDPNGNPLIDGSNNAEINIVSSNFNLTSACSLSSPGSCTLSGPPPWGRSGQVYYLPALVQLDSGKNICPSSCEGSTDYERGIECADVTTQYSCGTAGASWDNTVNPGAGGVLSISAAGAECLTHASSYGLNVGQDSLSYPVLYPNGPPVITAGQGPFAGAGSVSTSSSIVTIPIFDQSTFSSASAPVNIVGFLQAFVNQVECCGTSGPPAASPGDINITVLNVSACNGTGNGASPVVGGSGTSPVPVRLITSP